MDFEDMQARRPGAREGRLMTGVVMQTNKGTERPVKVMDLVQSLATHRCYGVTGINPETGRPNLYKHGHRRIRNANPAKYRIIEPSLEVSHA